MSVVLAKSLGTVANLRSEYVKASQGVLMILACWYTSLLNYKIVFFIMPAGKM